MMLRAGRERTVAASNGSLNLAGEMAWNWLATSWSGKGFTSLLFIDREHCFLVREVPLYYERGLATMVCLLSCTVGTRLLKRLWTVLQCGVGAKVIDLDDYAD
ncbi:MAG TPA: hypothetical protein VK436_01585 [Methanocella sp.]|nr:hypothetical protein [Methanocella sp.]